MLKIQKTVGQNSLAVPPMKQYFLDAINMFVVSLLETVGRNSLVVPPMKNVISKCSKIYYILLCQF